MPLWRIPKKNLRNCPGILHLSLPEHDNASSFDARTVSSCCGTVVDTSSVDLNVNRAVFSMEATDSDVTTASDVDASSPILSVDLNVDVDASFVKLSANLNANLIRGIAGPKKEPV